MGRVAVTDPRDLLCCGDVEANPGPGGPASPGHVISLDSLHQHMDALGVECDWEVHIPGPVSLGPSSTERPLYLLDKVTVVCVYCHVSLHLRELWQLTHHQITCTGRGAALLTCGDVEANPGPLPGPLGSLPLVPTDDSPAAGLDLGDQPMTNVATSSSGGPVRSRVGSRKRGVPPLEGPVLVSEMEVHVEDGGLDLAHQWQVPAALSQTTAAGNEESVRIRTAAALLSPSLPVLFSCTDILQARVPTVRHVPAAIQGDFSALLADAITQYCLLPSMDNLIRVLALPKLVLRAVNLRGKNSRDQLDAILRARMHTFRRGDLQQLWEDLSKDVGGNLTGARPETRAQKKARTTDDGISADTLRLVTRHVADGAPRKGLDVLLSHGTHVPADPSVISRLQALHPPGDPVPPDLFPPATEAPLQSPEDLGVWTELVRDCILHFPRGSAPGPSGLRPSHLQDALRRKGAGLGLLSALARLTQLWVGGLLPQSHASAWGGATLVPLRKADGGVRPVAIGDTLRRLVGKALLSTPEARKQVAALQPVQAGLGVPGAAESIGMGLQSLVNTLGPQSSWVVLQVDIANAFNTQHRSAILHSSLAHTPALYAFLRFTYLQALPLFLGGLIVDSCLGTQQGCPLGPVGFAVGIQDILVRLQTHGGLLWNVWYLDDGCLVGSPEAIVQAFSFLQKEFAALGLHLNTSKCKLWGPGAHLASADTAVPVVPWDPQSGILLLGTPVSYPGSSAFLERHWASKTAEIEEATNRITQVLDSQVAHHLLRKCLDSCKVNHLLRASDCYLVPEAVRDCDEAILSAFEEIAGSGMSPSQRIQAGLPFRQGGCGIKVPGQVRPAARISALARFHSSGANKVGVPDLAAQVTSGLVLPVLADLETVLGPNYGPLQRWKGDLTALGQADADHLQQKWWASALGTARQLQLLDVSTPRDQARLLEQQGGVGTAFMSVTPMPSLNSIFPTDSYRLGLQWWLGMPIMSTDSTESLQCPGCGKSVDPFGDHLLRCIRLNFSRRHNALQDCLAVLLQEAGQGVAREVPLPDCPEGDLRPADLLLRHWTQGKDTAVDVTISHAWTAQEESSNLPPTRERWRHFLVRKENLKKARYQEPCQAAGWGFQPAAFGTWGGTGPDAARLLHRITKRVAGWLEGDLRASRQEEARQLVGLTLMKGILEMLQGKDKIR